MDIDVLTAPFAVEELKSRPGSYGKLLTYAPLKSYIERMNAAFDYQWSLDVVKVERDENEIIAIVRVSSGGVSKTQAGSKHIVRNDQGEAYALGDDTKAAISDGFKKCCQLFGIGLELLNDPSDTPADNNTAGKPASSATRGRASAKATEKQLALIKQIRAEIGWSQEDVCALCDQLFGHDDVVNLNKTECSALITELKKHQTATRNTSRSPHAAASNF